jgi:hypothetical protein
VFHTSLSVQVAPIKGQKDICVGQLSIRCKEGADKASKESIPTVIRNDVCALPFLLIYSNPSSLSPIRGGILFCPIASQTWM